MILFSSAQGAACTVRSGSASFAVFPTTPKSGERALLSNPMEERMDKVISWPGEYDFDAIFVRAIGQNDGQQVSYVCEMSGVRCAFVHAPVLEWSDADIEKLGDVDVLLITADKEKNIRALVEAVDPRIVILIEGENGDIAAIAKAIGASEAEAVPELKVQSGSLPTDTRKVVVLKGN